MQAPENPNAGPEEAVVAFVDTTRIARGPLQAVVKILKDRAGDGPVHTDALVFAEDTGRQLDVDLSGTAVDVEARYGAPADVGEGAVGEPPRRRGRPKLGVVGREVSLLPRHWAWLEAQPSGASAVLRRLIDQARVVEEGPARRRRAAEAAGRIMWTLGGNLAAFEEASRALYADDRPALRRHMASWPEDLRETIEGILDRAAEGIGRSGVRAET